jgi:hypothetical protein
MRWIIHDGFPCLIVRDEAGAAVGIGAELSLESCHGSVGELALWVEPVELDLFFQVDVLRGRWTGSCSCTQSCCEQLVLVRRWPYASRMAKRVRKKTSAVFQLKITLNHVEPAIWRRLLVPAQITLGELHFVLNETMGWNCSHLHSFAISERTFGDPQLDPDGELHFEDGRCVSLESLLDVRQTLLYEYDFGDSWEHEVLIEKRVELDTRFCYPLCIGGERACPPEDSGGPFGYVRMLESLAQPKDTEHDEFLAWLGGYFDPEGFDVNRTNQALRVLPRSQRSKSV